MSAPTGFVGVTRAAWTIRSGFRPQMDFFVSDAEPWDQMDPAIPKYELYPPPEAVGTRVPTSLFQPGMAAK